MRVVEVRPPLHRADPDPRLLIHRHRVASTCPRRCRSARSRCTIGSDSRQIVRRLRAPRRVEALADARRPAVDVDEQHAISRTRARQRRAAPAGWCARCSGAAVPSRQPTSAAAAEPGQRRSRQRQQQHADHRDHRDRREHRARAQELLEPMRDDRCAVAGWIRRRAIE